MNIESNLNSTGSLDKGIVSSSFSSFVEQLADLTDRLEDPHSGYTLEIEQVTVNLPIQLNLSANDEGTITLDSSPPTQTVETSILPVFHRINLTIVATNGQ